MKSYFAAMAALGLLASASAYAQQTPPMSEQQGQQAGEQQAGEQQAGQQEGQRQELSSRFVKQIQARLHQQGFYDGKVTGTWDEDTSDALQNFQDANGLQPTGELDGATVLALELPGGPQAQPRQAGQFAPQGRMMRQMGGPMMGGSMGQMGGAMMGMPMGRMGGAMGQMGGPMMGGSTGQMGQGDQQSIIDAYQTGYQQGFEQGFRQSEIMASRQGQGAGQGSSQPPQPHQGGQQ